MRQDARVRTMHCGSVPAALRTSVRPPPRCKRAFRLTVLAQAARVAVEGDVQHGVHISLPLLAMGDKQAMGKVRVMGGWSAWCTTEWEASGHAVRHARLPCLPPQPPGPPTHSCTFPHALHTPWYPGASCFGSQSCGPSAGSGQGPRAAGASRSVRLAGREGTRWPGPSFKD